MSLVNDLQGYIENLRAELEKAYEATDIAVNGARSATFELSRVRVELEDVKALAAERLRRLDDMAGRVDSMLKQRDATWLGQLDAERARAEKLREALIQIRLGGLTSNQCQTIADEALADSEAKP